MTNKTLLYIGLGVAVYLLWASRKTDEPEPVTAVYTFRETADAPIKSAVKSPINDPLIDPVVAPLRAQNVGVYTIRVTG